MYSRRESGLIRSLWKGTRSLIAASAAEAVTGHKGAALAVRGDAARDVRRWAEAASSYRAALELSPDWWEIWVQYGHALKESGRHEDAELAYRKALSVQPAVADTHIQLGHLLKLRGRKEQAADAYVDALAHDPKTAIAREELLNLGWTLSRINHTVAARRSPGNKARQAPRAVAASGVSGAVLVVGLRSISGEVRGLTPDVLPIKILCASRRALLGSVVLNEASEDGVAVFEITLPAQIALSDQLQLHVTIEPVGVELENSPLMLPGPEVADVLRRLERLEFRMTDLEGRSNPRAEWDATFDAMYRELAERVESILDQQRTLFDRQLVAAGGWSGRSEEGAVHEIVHLTPDDPVLGYGWFPPEASETGGRHRWIGKQAFLSTRLAGDADVLLTAEIDEAMSEHLPGLIAVLVAETPVQSWVSRTPEGWRLSARIPGELRHGDGSFGILFRATETLFVAARDPRWLSVAFSDIRLHSIPTVTTGSVRLQAESPFVVARSPGEGVAGETVTAVLPGMPGVEGFDLHIGSEAPLEDPVVLLNGWRLKVVGNGAGLKCAVPADFLNGRSNLLEIAGDGAAGCNSIEVATRR